MVNAIHVSFPSHDCHSTHAYRMRDWRLFIRYSKNQSYRKLDKIGHKLLPTYLLTSTLCIAFRDDIVTKLGFGSNKNISSLTTSPHPARFPVPFARYSASARSLRGSINYGVTRPLWNILWTRSYAKRPKDHSFLVPADYSSPLRPSFNFDSKSFARVLLL